jgi:hypothetical protein
MKTIIIGLVLIFIPTILLFMFYYYEINEPFAASQGGALIQLMAGKVYSENEMEEMLKYQKKAVVKDILGLTEPDSQSGPYPANGLIRM